MNLNIAPRTKNILIGIAVAIFLVVFAVWIFSSPRSDHIEDANGADNYAPQTIHKQDVISQKMGMNDTVSEFLPEDVDKTGTPEHIIADENTNFQFIAPTGF